MTSDGHIHQESEGPPPTAKEKTDDTGREERGVGARESKFNLMIIKYSKTTKR